MIENIGSGAAYDIKFDINPDFEYLKGKFLSELNIMKNIKYLPPNRRIEFFLTNLLDDFEKLTKIRFDIKSTYNDYFGEIHNESFGIDFSELKDISRIENTPLKDIAKSIDKISKDFRHITSGFKRLYTKTIIENERELEE
ncbi:MAG: hypothetical protein GY855_12290 [candidate division Zixibacteria bacterium]|nr:hypothetical protein [candidate division Zixibacteria bacterium]